MKNVITEYLKHDTTFSSTSKLFTEFRIPTITLCFEDEYKPSVIKELDLKYPPRTVMILGEKFYEHENIKNQPIEEIYENLTYNLNKDWYLKINGNSMDLQLHKGLNEITLHHNKTSIFNVFSAPTFNNGACTVIEPIKGKLKSLENLDLDIRFDEKLKTDYPEKVNIFITSNTTWYGVINNLWLRYDPMKITADLKSKSKSRVIEIYIKEDYYQYINKNKHCEGGCKIANCFQFEEALKLLKKCPEKCLPFLYEGNRQPETVFVPQMFVPENGQSWQRVCCLLF